MRDDLRDRPDVDPNGLGPALRQRRPDEGLDDARDPAALGHRAFLQPPSRQRRQPFSEALFRTLKYRPAIRASPSPASSRRAPGSLASSAGTTTEHRHSGIRFVTPDERHDGRDVAILARRAAVYEQARRRRPERWAGSTRNWTPVGAVYLNPQQRDVTDIRVARLAS